MRRSEQAKQLMSEKTMQVLDELYRSRVLRKARCIIQDEYHPANSLFELTRSGDRYRWIRTRSDRTMESFYPTAIRTLNERH